MMSSFSNVLHDADSVVAHLASLGWLWTMTNSARILFILYFVSVACMILLALHIRDLSSRIGHIKREWQRRSTQLDDIAAEAARNGITRDAESIRTETQDPQSVQTREMILQLQTELSLVKARLASLETIEPPQPTNMLATHPPSLPRLDLTTGAARRELVAIRSEMCEDESAS